MSLFPLATQTLAWLKHAADSGQCEPLALLHLIARADAGDRDVAKFLDHYSRFLGSYSKTIAALCRRLEVLERVAGLRHPVEGDATQSDSVVDAVLQAKLGGRGQEPSVADVDELCAEFGFHYADLDSLEMLRDMIAAALARWAHASAAAPEPRENPATPSAPETPAEALAVRPLLEKVAAMANNIGAHTVNEIAAISSRAEAWLRDNPPGARSCVESATPARVPGDVATVAQWLQDHALECRKLGRNDWAEQSIRAAVLIQRLAFPAYLVVGRPPEGFSDLLAKLEPGEVQICSTGVSIEPLGDAPGPTFQDAIRLAELDDQRREAVHQAVAEALGSGAYDCTRVWSAWQVGTMGKDDFCLLAENPDRVAEIADAAIEAIRAIPAPQAGEVEG